MSRYPLAEEHERTNQSSRLIVGAIQHASGPAEKTASTGAAQLNTFFETTTDCVFRLDRQWRFTYLNRRAIDEVAHGRDLIGLRISAAFDGLVGSPFWQRFSGVMKDQQPRTGEGYFAPLGSWYEVHVAPTDDGVVAFFRNIDARKALEKEKADDAERLHEMLDAIPQMVWSVSGDGRDRYYNAQWREFTGVDPEAEGTSRLELVHPEDRVAAGERWQQSRSTGALYEFSYRLRHRSGEHRWILSRAKPELLKNGEISRWYGTCTDIHEQVLAKEALEVSEARLRSIIDATPDCVSILDLEGHIQYLNRAAEKAFEFLTPASLIGHDWIEEVAASARDEARLAFYKARSGEIGHFTAAHREMDITTWWDVIIAPVHSGSGELSGCVATARDITHQKRIEEQAHWNANHDALTGLANRTLFQKVLDEMLGAAMRSKECLAVFMFDLDDLKRTNDALGHDAGDAILRTFAERLRGIIREGDLIARLGGDEFALILKSVGTEAEIEAMLQSIFETLQEPCVLQGRLLDIRTSVGASLFPWHASTSAELLKAADIALYSAKSDGRGIGKVFAPQMRDNLQQRLSMLSTAKRALEHSQVEPFYQPKLELRTRRVEGFEALLRWRHPSRGLQHPSTIKAAFDDMTLAAEISDQMISSVISDMQSWTEDGVEFGHIAINVAAAEFRRGDFADKLLERMHEADLSSSRLQVEVTETVFLGRGAEYVEQALKTLATAGVQIALDDFGTGYASLSHLKQFPVHILKIDRSFIQNLTDDDEDAAIVRAVIKLAASLGMKVVAEGIETDEQLGFLMRHRCQIGQGFLFGQAVPAEELPAVLTRWSGAGLNSDN